MNPLPAARTSLFMGRNRSTLASSRPRVGGEQDRDRRARSQPIRITGRLLVMSEASGYSAIETLRDGRPVEIRSLRPDDRAGLIAAVERASDQSLFRRFFAAKR